MTQGTVIIFDVGKNSLGLDRNSDKSFFQRSKEFITRVIERKIMTLEKEVLGIVLMGSENEGPISMNSKLESPCWNMIRNLPCTPTENTGDWFESLIYAADFVTRTNIACKMQIINKRIILVSNFMTSSAVGDDKKEEINSQLYKENFQVDVIGFDLDEETYKKSDINLAKKLVDDTKGVNVLFDDAMMQMCFYKKKHVTGKPWKINLFIGPNIKIPILSYIRIKDEKVLKTWIEAVKDTTTNKASTVEKVKKKAYYYTTENKIVNCKDLVKGVRYGEEIIPISSIDKHLYYNSGPESLNIYGFTSATNLKWENLNYNNLSYVFGCKGDKKARNAIKCLAQCLMEENLIAIARGVRKENSAPRVYALMPVQEGNEFICLSMVGICYKEEIQYMTFPQTECKKFICSNEQVDAFKNLIKAMDLSNNDVLDGSEAFPVSEVPSPSAQYTMDCIVFRAKNPDKPLPEPKNDIINLFQVPPSIKIKAAEPLERLKSMFVLHKVNDCEKDNKSEVMDFVEDCKDNIKTEDPQTHNVHCIGTVNPISDYNVCLSLGKSLNTVAQEMTDAIETLIHSNLDEHKSKALDAMMFYRTECVKENPLFYNKWLKNFKMELFDRNSHDILKLIEDKGMNYILYCENTLSHIKSVDSEMCELDTPSNITDDTISSEVTEFFNNM